MTKYVVAALYEFADLPDYTSLQAPLLDLCLKCGIKGTLLLASEGINGTVAGTREGIDEVLSYIRSDERLKELVHKESYTDTIPFYRMKVRLKKEIVSMGVKDIKPKELVGTYIEPEDWNSLIADPDVLVIDTRNTYEYNIGTFKKAIDPQTETFRKFPEYVANNLDPSKYKKVAMFCTGGIRCEKATSFMLKQGFEEVYHLKGGILKYLEDIPEEDSLWEGECYVFDNRVSVNHKLEKGAYEQCHGCRYPITEDDIKSPKYQKGVSCPNCYDSITPDKKERYTERQHQVELAKLRNTTHIGSNHTQSTSD